MGILTALGLSAVIVFAGGEIRSDLVERRQLEGDIVLSALANRIGGLTHELQKERGASAGFLASGGTAFAEALPRQRAESDRAIAEFTAAVDALRTEVPIGNKLDAMLLSVAAQINDLAALRAAIDTQSVERGAAVGQITKLNRTAIALLPEIGKNISYSNASRAMQRHAVFMTAKDVMGLERAIGAAGFAQAQTNAGVIPEATLTRFAALVDQQTTLLSVYQGIASDAMLAKIDAMLMSGDSASVLAMRAIAFSNQPAEVAEITPETWFDAITEKINLMKEVEDFGAAEIDRFTELALVRLSGEIRATWISLAGNVILLTAISAILIFLTSRSLNTTANRVAALAAGDIDSPVVPAPQRDLAKITEALSKFQVAERERLAEAKLQRDLEASSAAGIKRISASVSKGDFQARLRLRDLQGASLILGQGINEILQTAEGFVIERERADAALISEKQAENDAQERAVASLEAVVTAYSSGDYSQRMSSDGLNGVWRSVADGINQIAGMTEEALTDIRMIMTALKNGSLDERMSTVHKGTFAEIAAATNASLDTLKDLFSGISEEVGRLGDATSELRGGASELTSRSDEQASTVADATEAAGQLSKTIEDNGQNLGRCNELMRKLQAKTAEGQGVAKGAITSMSGIEDASGEMEKIVGTIDEIAFQTNLLALNASVEAARAGDAGKGFAVVAAEVRGLANRCAEASRQIGELISDSVKGVTEGAGHVRKTGQAIGEVEETLKAVQTVIGDVLVAGEKQSAGVVTLSQAVERLGTIAASNVDLARGNMTLTETLSAQETRLSDAVGRYLDANSGPRKGPYAGAA